MEDGILLSRRGELCPMRLQQLSKSQLKVCQNELKAPFFLTRHDRQNDLTSSAFIKQIVGCKSQSPRFLGENTDTCEPTWMVECLHASSTHFTDMHAASQWDLGKIPSFFWHAMDVLKLRPQADSMIFRLNSVKICVWICIGVPVVFGMFI